MAGRIGVWAAALAVLALGGQAQGAVQPSGAALSAITGSPNVLPQSWGARNPQARGLIADIPMPTGAVEPSAVDLAAPPSAPAADEVSAVTVQGRRAGEDFTPGPAWWKVTKGDATTWIMATPDAMPVRTSFDDRALAQKIAAARLVIAPDTRPPPRSRFPPQGGLALPATPLFERLPKPLADRLAQRLENDPVRAQGDLKLISGFQGCICTPIFRLHVAHNEPSSPQRVAERLAIRSAPPGAMGNPAADRAASLALRGNVLLQRVAADESKLLDLADYVEPDEAAQEACLGRVLDQLDEGWDAEAYRQDVAAWGIGDVAHAVKRYSILTTCSFGPAGDALWAAMVGAYVDAIDKAMAQPGQVVAIVEFDPLQIKGGVLDQLRAKGYQITSPEGAD